MLTETTEQLDQSDELDGVMPENVQETETPQAKASPAPNDEMRSAIAELAGLVKQSHAQAAPQSAAQPPLSEDEKAELWGIYNPEKSDKDFYRKFLRLNSDMDPAEIERAVTEFRPVFEAMRQGLSKQALVGARNMLAIEMQRLRDEFAPALQYSAQAQAEARRDRFFSAYPALNDPKFEKILMAAGSTLDPSKFSSDSDFFKALADGAAQVIQGVLPSFSLGSPATQTKPNSRPNTPRLPRTTVGGTGGTSGGGKSSDGPRDDSDSIF